MRRTHHHRDIWWRARGKKETVVRSRLLNRLAYMTAIFVGPSCHVSSSLSMRDFARLATIYVTPLNTRKGEKNTHTHGSPRTHLVCTLCLLRRVVFAVYQVHRAKLSKSGHILSRLVSQCSLPALSFSSALDKPLVSSVSISSQYREECINKGFWQKFSEK